MNTSPLRQPSAWLPISMSLVALSLVLVHVARFGPGPEADEGTSAHLFQMLILAQVPIVGLFAVKWLPVAPKPALWVLALQAAAVVLAFAAVYWFNL